MHFKKKKTTNTKINLTQYNCLWNFLGEGTFDQKGNFNHFTSSIEHIVFAGQVLKIKNLVKKYNYGFYLQCDLFWLFVALL